MKAPSVLLVDDEIDVLCALADELRGPFDVTTARSAEEALDLLTPGRYSAIVSDVRMPGLGGVELLRRAAAIDPMLVRVFLTGYGDDAVHDAANSTGAYKLRKPWGDEVEILLRRAIEQREQVAALGVEIQGYVTFEQGRPGDPEVTAPQILAHLRATLEAIPDVDRATIEPAPALTADDRWIAAAGPTRQPGPERPWLLEYLIEGPEKRDLRLRVQLRSEPTEIVSRFADLAVGRAREALRMRSLADEVRASVDEAERMRTRAFQSERLASLGALASSVAHDLATPLAVLRANREFVSQWADHVRETREVPDDSELPGILEDDRLALETAVGILDALRSFASSQVVKTTCALPDLVDRTLRLVRQAQRRSGVSVVTEMRDPPLVSAVPLEVAQILMNLVLNAIQASPRGGRVVIEAEAAEGGLARVRVRNPGVVPAGIRERMFEPFFTTKPSGLGLGLSISRSLAARQGGELDVQDDSDQTVFVLTLRVA